MTRGWEKFLALGLVLLATSAQPEPVGSLTRSGASTFVQHNEGDKDYYEITNTTYLAANVTMRNSQNSINVLFEQKSVVTQDWDGDSVEPTLTVNAYVISRNGLKKPIWMFTEPADRGEIWSEYYKTTLFGREGGADLYGYHDLATGSFSFFATTDPVLVYPSNPSSADPIIICFLQNIAEFGFAKRNPDSRGVIVVEQGNRFLDWVIVEGGNLNWPWYQQDLTAFVQPLGNSDPVEEDHVLSLGTARTSKREENSGNFQIRLTIGKGVLMKSFIIPVRQGRLAIANAKVPSGVTLRREDGALKQILSPY